MKKLFIKTILAGVLVLAGLAVCLALFLGFVIKKGVETVGPQLTKTGIKLEGVSLSLLSGRGEIRGLVVGNPAGYKTDRAIALGKASLELAPKSLMSDKVVIKSFVAIGPEITFEGGFKENNLSKILDNVNSVTGGGAKEPSQEPKPTTEPKPEKKEPGQTRIQVDEFLLSGAKLHVSLAAMAGKALVLPLPAIELRNLGQGPEGITVAELVQQILDQVSKSSAKAVAESGGDLGKGALDALQDAPKGSTGGVDKAIQEIGDLFKKKE